MLNEIADLLRTWRLKVDLEAVLDPSATSVWIVTDPISQVAIRVMIVPDHNGHPIFWAEAFSSYAAKYVVPIITRIGDAREEIVERHLNARRFEAH